MTKYSYLYGVRCDAEFLPGAPLFSVPQGESVPPAAGAGPPPAPALALAAAACTTAEEIERAKNLVGVLGWPEEEEEEDEGPLTLALWPWEDLRLRRLSLGDGWGRRALLKDLQVEVDKHFKFGFL